jgi:hypothetical protein
MGCLCFSRSVQAARSLTACYGGLGTRLPLTGPRSGGPV